MKQIILTLGLICAVPVAHAWENADLALESTYLATHLIDWGQTHDIAERCAKGRKMRESNPILGDCPRRDVVDAWFALTALAHVAIAYGIPDKQIRRGFIAFTLGIETAAVTHNVNVGIQVRF